MRRIRVIPVLLLQNGKLVKSVRFKNYQYVGDPINTIKIFNEKEVDEIAILDISATPQNTPPDIARISALASEAFMPMSYGGGITKLDEVKRILYEGFEKVIINSSVITNSSLISEIANVFGSQSVVASIDFGKDWLGRNNCYSHCGTQNTKIDPLVLAKRYEEAGAGEIFLNSIEKDGTYNGYELELIQMISQNTKIPLIACGGAGSIDDFHQAVKSGASAVAAGSFFVFQRPHQAVLISYPSRSETKIINRD